MDDPLSALDLQVGEYIVKETLLKQMRREEGNRNRNRKTVVVVTHALNYLKYFDYIYVVEGGEVVIEGDYQKVSREKEVQELIEKYKSSVE